MSAASGSGGEATLLASGNGVDEADIPSPSMFANIAAAVGEQNPLTHATTIAPTAGAGAPSVSTTPKTGVQSAASVSDMAIVAMHAMDPYSALVYNTEHFVNVQLKQLLDAAARFFSLYRNSYTNQSLAEDEGGAAQAHSTLLAVIDQLLLTASQAGFGGLPCPRRSDSGVHSSWLHESDQYRPGDDGSPAAKDEADSFTTAMLKLSNDTFERRERMRESASIVTSILTNS